MDNSSGESNVSLDVNQASAAFENFFSAPEEVKSDEPLVDTEIDLKQAPAEVPEAPPEPEQDAPADEPVTVKIDGKDVVLTKEQIAQAYKDGLRQADYTKKTMEVAEQRKTAQAETAKAQQERATYADNLNRMAAQLEGVLEVQQQTNWDELLKSDPVEYLAQQRLAQQRYAQLQQVNQQRGLVEAQMKAESEKAHQSFIESQQQELLAKLPAWTDEAKAKAEKEAIRAYLSKEGYDDKALQNVSDHKAVILARKAMLYDQMIEKANAAAKKVQALPTKVERPGVADQNNVDRRTASIQRFNKTGSIEDASRAFSSMFS